MKLQTSVLTLLHFCCIPIVRYLDDLLLKKRTVWPFSHNLMLKLFLELINHLEYPGLFQDTVLATGETSDLNFQVSEPFNFLLLSLIDILTTEGAHTLLEILLLPAKVAK